jgi:general nucleoside transport system ATP-binding protein
MTASASNIVRLGMHEAEQQAPPGQSLLRLEGVTKSYPSVIATDDIDLEIKQGEIHAVLGENGAGKSTLMKIIFGATQPDSGRIFWRGEPVEIASPAKARALGIGMVFQHFTLFETVSVAENISLTVAGPPDELKERIVQASKEFGLPVDPHAIVYQLSVGERQRVELLRCLLSRPSLLILDEPTAVLPPQSIERLFVTLRTLSEQGIAVLYISHKLEEIRKLCHSATILRQGKVTGRVDPSQESAQSLARMMIGREVHHAKHSNTKASDVVSLRVTGLSVRESDPHAIGINNVSFELRRGEILGVAGVSGNGQRALIRLLSGEATLPASRSSQIEMLGVPVGHFNAGQRRQLGLSFIPEERLGRGAASALPLTDNALLTGHRLGMVSRGFIRKRIRNLFTDQCIKQMNVHCAGRSATAGSLSGGNLQKFIVGRELLLQPKLLIASQPTWGIDVGAAEIIRQRLLALRDEGVSILVVSEELDELFEISDRLVVMFEGRMSAPVATRHTTPNQIGQMMLGMLESPQRTQLEVAQ